MLVKDIACLASVSQTFECPAASLCHRHVRPSSCARAHQLPSWPRAMKTGQLRVHRGLSAVYPGAIPGERLDDGCIADSAESPRHDLSTFRDPVTRLWAGLLLLCTCTYRCGIRAQAFVFLMTQLLYVGLHLKPLAPLTSRSSPVDEIFLRQFTTGRYFASELFLLWLLAFASPIRLILLSSFQTSCVFSSRATVPKAIVGVHAAFHVLYTILATFCREWSLQQNVSRVQISREGGQSIPRTLWAWLLNFLNLADAGLHLLYLFLFARQLC